MEGLGCFSPCIFHASIFLFLSQSSHTKVGNTVRLPPPRIPSGKPGQAPLLSASLSGSPSWSFFLPFVGNNPEVSRNMLGHCLGFLSLQPPPSILGKDEKMTLLPLCSPAHWFKDHFFKFKGSVWNSGRTFTLKSQALANQKIFDFKLGYLVIVQNRLCIFNCIHSPQKQLIDALGGKLQSLVPSSL